MGVIDGVVLNEDVFAAIDNSVFFVRTAFHAYSIIACINDAVYNKSLMAVTEIYCVTVLGVPRATYGYTVNDDIAAIERMYMKFGCVLKCNTGEEYVFTMVDT